MTAGDNLKNRAAYTREGRKQLFAVLQGARGSSGDCLFVSDYVCLQNFFCSLRPQAPQPDACICYY